MGIRGSFGQWTTTYTTNPDSGQMTGAQAHRWAVARGQGCTGDCCTPDRHRSGRAEERRLRGRTDQDTTRRRGGRDQHRKGGRRAR